MLTSKRVIIATVLGVIFGFVCMGFACCDSSITTEILVMGIIYSFLIELIASILFKVKHVGTLKINTKIQKI